MNTISYIIFPIPPPFSPPSSTFLIEGFLKSKNLFATVDMSAQIFRSKPLFRPHRSYLCPLATIFDFVGCWVFKALQVPLYITGLESFNWHERAAFGRSTAGNDVVATIIISLFSFFFFPVFFPCFFFLRRDLFS